MVKGSVVTASFASFSPRLVRPRTTLMAAMRLSASQAVMIRLNSVCSSTASAAAAGPAIIIIPPPAGAEASTPKVVSICFTSSAASSSCAGAGG